MQKTPAKTNLVCWEETGNLHRTRSVGHVLPCAPWTFKGIVLQKCAGPLFVALIVENCNVIMKPVSNTQ